MPRMVKALSDTQIKNAKAKIKDVMLYDGNGLQILIRKSGTKSWQYRYKSSYSNRWVIHTLGTYPSVSLREAREASSKIKQQLESGEDPRVEVIKQKTAILAQTQSLFEQVAYDYYELYKKKGYKEYAINRFIRGLQIHVFPYIGHIPVKELSPPMVIPLIKRIENSGQIPNAARIAARINQVMDHAMNLGFLTVNPLEKIGKLISPHKAKNNPTLRPEEFFKIYHAISNSACEVKTKLVIEWQFLTMTRPVEAASAKWCEIDFSSALWVIPAERMKMDRDHIVVLSTQALTVLEFMKKLTGNYEYVFTHRNDPKRHMNSQSANNAIKHAGFKDIQTAHGLRALASTALNEKQFNPELIEFALSHVDRNSVRSTYNHSRYIEPRREIMQWLGDFAQEAAGGLTTAQQLLSDKLKY